MKLRIFIVGTISGAVAISVLAFIFLSSSNKRITVYALNPYGFADEDMNVTSGEFHGFEILDSTKINDADEIETIKTALQLAIDEASDDEIMCFEPRHGIRMKQGLSTMDYLICLECEK